MFASNLRLQKYNNQSLSDHRLLYFKVDNPGDGKVLTRNYTKANWPIFTTIVESELGPPPSLWSNSIIESASLMLTQVINSALDKACPKHLEKKRDKLFWWNQECQLAKVHYKKLERKMLRSLGGPSVLQREEVKKARNALKHTIRRAKMHSFRTFVRETENVPAMSRLNKILDQKQSHPLGFIKKPNGEITTSTRETLNVMMAEHFPGSLPVQEPGDDREFDDPPRQIETCNWINNFRIRTAISQFGPMKSPGTDGLKPIVMQNLPDSAISYLRCLYNACIQLSYTPIQWCHSKVIFIPKYFTESTQGRGLPYKCNRFVGRHIPLEKNMTAVFSGQKLTPILRAHLSAMLRAICALSKQVAKSNPGIRSFVSSANPKGSTAVLS